MKILEGIRKYSCSNRTALVCDDEYMSYSELESSSEAIASFLINKYNNANTPVVIYGNKENLMMSVMIAALKSGRAYIPIDVSYPKERVEIILDEIGTSTLFNFNDNVKFDNIEVFDKEDILNIIRMNKGENIDKEYWVKGDENAYILFTSGSTGKPKGVQISSNNLDNFVKWISEYLKLGDDEEIFMNQAAYSFDLSVMSIYPALCYGKTLHGISKKTLSNLKEMFSDIKKSNINYWVSTPSFASMCIIEENFNLNMLKNLKAMIFVGEVFSKKLCNELMVRFPNTRMINGYGPTEATVAVSINDICQSDLKSKISLPVGFPMDSSIIKIVDENGIQIGEQQKGEIVIIGPSVSKGYFNDIDMTEKSFFSDYYKEKKCAGYKTGDIGYYKDGKLYYCGRRDFQIKLSGYRIEIEDIEKNLLKVRNVKNCAIIPIYKDEKVAYLKAFVELFEYSGGNYNDIILQIKKDLLDIIPEYMVPRNIKIIENMPMNINGKIDRKRLMEENIINI